MKHEIKSPADLGNAIRATRKEAGIRLDDLSAMLEVSKQTTANLEYGKDTVALGTVLKHLQELGIRLYVDIPSAKAMQRLLKLSEGNPEACERILEELKKPPAQFIQPSGFSAAMEALGADAAPPHADTPPDGDQP